MSTQVNIKLKADLARLSGPPLESIESISESIPDVKPPKSDIITVHLRIVKIEDAVKRATGEKFGTYVYLIDLDADDESLDTVQKVPYLVEQKYYFRLTVFKDASTKIQAWSTNDIVTVQTCYLQKYRGNCCQGTLSNVLDHEKHVFNLPTSLIRQTKQTEEKEEHVLEMTATSQDAPDEVKPSATTKRGPAKRSATEYKPAKKTNTDIHIK
ncbi:unnamed protein product [Aphanomyces euteiches]|uniref:Uncharacterized protein n=1 Tax=Aphanomyces euteiches TaxID=100861 RepID=A0A6G0XKY9_9STRA|nr:hypothetical protein Ae201684_003596 [Aphanomyces euteiches]KAH9084754.1 hypothetical protein Ae201684P_001994 [Aphanomyces euteiches]KAH9136709.1 hypothetical protein AeRB84_018284 [Aphanomyces euteiches]